MKISDIAKKLNIPIKELREQAKELEFVITQKSQTMSDKKAREFIEKLKDKTKESGNDIIKEEVEEIKEVKAKEIFVPAIITVKEFSEKMNLPVTRVITELMKNGVMASINENIDFETAEIVGEFLGFKIKKETEKKETEKKYKTIGTKKERPPVVTIIGHVDHGKTTLLDHIRKTNVVGGESGGITQHIGAYQVERRGRKITFLDTPGHAAFSAMREHGVRITDVAVLIVAADDGVKPQTKEAVNFAREAGVPIVVAINKIDKPEADIEKTKKQLADIGLIPEEWGGKTVMSAVSAKTEQGIEELLDLILLVADMKKTESFIDVPANGFVVESHLSGSKGPVATILIRDGVLKIGDAFIVGKGVSGKIRMMTDYKNKKIKEAGPSVPVRISGLSDTPNFGELLEVRPSLKEAKSETSRASRQITVKGIAMRGLAEVSSSIRSGELKELYLIIKADVAGSLRAIEDAIGDMQFEEVRVKIINSDIGDITESDVKMASASGALIIGFRVDVVSNAKKLIEHTGVRVERFDIIYELIDKITLTLTGLLEPEKNEVEIGKGKVLQIFRDGRKDKILGIRLTKGELETNIDIKIFREQELLTSGKITSLKNVDKDISEIKKTGEYGIGVSLRIEGDERIKIEENDSFIAYKKEEKQKELKRIE